jgi:hypothetical protein
LGDFFVGQQSARELLADLGFVHVLADQHQFVAPIAEDGVEVGLDLGAVLRVVFVEHALGLRKADVQVAYGVDQLPTTPWLHAAFQSSGTDPHLWRIWANGGKA